MQQERLPVAGKGSRQRHVDKKRFDSNWDKIFGKKYEESGRERALQEVEDRPVRVCNAERTGPTTTDDH